MKRGELTTAQCAWVAARGLAETTLAMPASLRSFRGSTGVSRLLITPPDSQLVREATDRAVHELSLPILEHSRRCWQWSMAFAEIDGLLVDPEETYVAAMLHDIALGGPASAEYGCFAALGGAVAAGIVEPHRAPATAERVSEAISAHFDPRQPDAPLARALHAAVHLDVVGRRLAEVRPELVVAVEDAHPRESFAAEFASALRREAQFRPRSTGAVLWRAGARLPMALNPLNRR